MLVVTGTFENERFIPDRPVSFPQKKKAVLIIEENPDATKVITETKPVSKWREIGEAMLSCDEELAGSPQSLQLISP